MAFRDPAPQSPVPLSAIDGAFVAHEHKNRSPTTFTPEIHHPKIASVKLFTQKSDFVKPNGIAVAPDGRVFVQENHTHKRNSNCSAPKKRILLFEDTDHLGLTDKRPSSMKTTRSAPNCSSPPPVTSIWAPDGSLKEFRTRQESRSDEASRSLS